MEILPSSVIPELMLPRRNLFIYKLQSVWGEFAALGKSKGLAPFLYNLI
jgi:hypothetical protein